MSSEGFQQDATSQRIEVSSGHRGIALAVAAIIVLVACITIPWARTPGPVITPFLPAYLTAVLVLDLVTALLFLLHYRQRGGQSTLALSCAYLYTACIVVPHALAFPGVFSPTGLLDAGPQSAVWLWVFWHGGFPALLLVYCFLRAREQRTGWPVPAPSGHAIAVAFAATLLLVAVLAAAATLGHDRLPTIIRRDDYLVLVTSGVGPAVFLLNLAALAAAWHVTRGRSVTQLWLLVALLASLLDVAVTLAAGARYSLGWYVARLNSLFSASAVLGAFIFEFHQLQQRLAAANLRLAELADTDALTGLGNRRAFDRRLAEEWVRAAREGQSLGLLLLDVDHFKRYNDSYGHPAGDACLQRVAEAVRASLHRPGDYAARYGGEELAVIVPGTDHAGTLHVAETMRRAIEALGIEHRESPAGRVTASLGIAVMTAEPAMNASALVAGADAALYAAKRDGRNRVGI